MAITTSWTSRQYGLVVEESKPLGFGYFGKVWKARHVQNGKFYALKEISISNALRYYFNTSSVSGEPFFKLQREVQNLSKIDNENVVKYHNCWLEGPDIENLLENSTRAAEDLLDKMRDGTSTSDAVNFLYIQMEYCDLELKKYLKNNSLEQRRNQIQNIFQNLSKGLEAIHSQNIIHRDIKAENIFCSTSTGQNGMQYTWKIGDFGLSVQMESDMNEASAKSFRGTDPYKSPEMKKQGKYDANTDVYSLGLVFVEILYPFESNEDKESYFRDLSTEIIDPSCVRNLISTNFKKETEIIEEMLQTDTTLRINSKDLREVLDGSLSLEEIESVTSRRARNAHTEPDVPNTFFHSMIQTSSNFKGREIEFEKFREITSKKHPKSIIVISGAEVQERSEFLRQLGSYVFKEIGRSCIWIDGESEQTFQNSFIQLAKELKISTLDHETVPGIFEQVHTKFKISPLVFLIDNLETAIEGIRELLKEIKRCGPPQPLLIITTENRDVLGKGVGESILMQ